MTGAHGRVLLCDTVVVVFSLLCPCCHRCWHRQRRCRCSVCFNFSSRRSYGSLSLVTSCFSSLFWSSLLLLLSSWICFLAAVLVVAAFINPAHCFMFGRFFVFLSLWLCFTFSLVVSFMLGSFCPAPETPSQIRSQLSSARGRAHYSGRNDSSGFCCLAQGNQPTEQRLVALASWTITTTWLLDSCLPDYFSMKFVWCAFLFAASFMLTQIFVLWPFLLCRIWWPNCSPVS